jgi:hypothetical protein
MYISAITLINYNIYFWKKLNNSGSKISATPTSFRTHTYYLIRVPMQLPNYLRRSNINVCLFGTA